MMEGKVLLFGKLKDAFGAASVPLPDGVGTAATLRVRLSELYPDLASQLMAKSVRIAVNQKLVADESAATLSAADEIALLPPLSGG
jgi:molybdopterin converting factor small subunit